MFILFVTQILNSGKMKNYKTNYNTYYVLISEDVYAVTSWLWWYRVSTVVMKVTHVCLIYAYEHFNFKVQISLTLPYIPL